MAFSQNGSVTKTWTLCDKQQKTNTVKLLKGLKYEGEKCKSMFICMLHYIVNSILKT